MPLETATFIPDLNAANPAHTDGLNAADSHMRLTKSAIKATFPNFTAAALQASQAQLDAVVGASLGTTPTRFAAGTGALPGLTPVGDIDTGFWSIAPNALGVSLGGVIQYFFTNGGDFAANGSVYGQTIRAVGQYLGGTGQLVPIGSTLLWWDDVLPAEGGYAWANGGTLSRTAFPLLWARWGTFYGVGDGATTFNVPDLRDAVPVGKSTMGGAASRALQTLGNTVLGTLIGAANVVLGIANLPTITSTNASQAISVASSRFLLGTPSASSLQDFNPANATGFRTVNNTASLVQETSTGNNSISVTSTGTTSSAVNNVQPSTTCNFIIRVG